MFSLDLINLFLFSFASCIHNYISKLILRKLHFLIFILVKNLGGPSVHGDRIGWGLFVQRDQSIGDPLSGTKHLRTICVWDQICLYQPFRISTLAWIWLIDFYFRLHLVFTFISIDIKNLHFLIFILVKIWGTICPWGPNWLGTVCPEGPIN